MLAKDGHGCRDYEGYLLYSESTALKSAHLGDERNFTSPISPLKDPLHMKNVIALTFDFRRGSSNGFNRIFFSDIHFGNIQQINDDASGHKVIVESEYLKTDDILWHIQVGIHCVMFHGIISISQCFKEKTKLMSHKVLDPNTICHMFNAAHSCLFYVMPQL